jgi:hypothetical protein
MVAVAMTASTASTLSAAGAEAPTAIGGYVDAPAPDTRPDPPPYPPALDDAESIDPRPVTAPPKAEEGLSDAEALRSDAEFVANELGENPDDVLRFLYAQRVAGDIDLELQEMMADLYAGLWIDLVDGKPFMTVARVGERDVSEQAVRSRGWTDGLQIVEVNYTVAELLAAGERIAA